MASQILQHCPHSINVIKLEGEFALIQALQIRPIKHENMLLLAAFQAVDVNDLEDSNQIDEWDDLVGQNKFKFAWYSIFSDSFTLLYLDPGQIWALPLNNISFIWAAVHLGADMAIVR